MFERIRSQVAHVPRGRVTTYGAVARSLGLKNSRLVGWALHQNKDSQTCPCHRVVSKEGKLASGFAFGGAANQRQLLESEGITFCDENTVDLIHLYKFDN